MFFVGFVSKMFDSFEIFESFGDGVEARLVGSVSKVNYFTVNNLITNLRGSTYCFHKPLDILPQSRICFDYFHYIHPR